MIVVDSNIVAYLYMGGAARPGRGGALGKDSGVGCADPSGEVSSERLGRIHSAG